MANEPTKKITVPEGSSLAKLLTDAAVKPILLEKNGELYRLERMENTKKAPTPEEVTRSRDGILKAAGSWKDINTEAFKAYIADRRHTANRPSVKLWAGTLLDTDWIVDALNGQDRAIKTVLELAFSGLAASIIT
jgi:hypothetical protein